MPISKHTLFLADARKMGSFLDKNSVDLIVTGPPYWNEVTYSNHDGQLSLIQDYDRFLKELSMVWEGCSHALKDGGIIAIWVHDIFRDKGAQYHWLPFHADILRELPQNLVLKNISIWDRYLHKDRGRFLDFPMIGSRYQYILILQKQGTHNNRKLIEESLRNYFWHPIWHKKTHPKLMGSGILYRVLFTLTKPVAAYLPPIRKIMANQGMIRDKHEFTSYPTECPEEVAEKIINDYSRRGNVILDPFVGSGTTIKVANKLGRICIGIEINRDAMDTIIAKAEIPDLTLKILEN